MRKIVLFIASSLDNFIARKNGDVSWLFTDQDYGYKKFYYSVDVLLVGRKTYEQALSFGEWPYIGKKCYVFTRKKNFDALLLETDLNVQELSKHLSILELKGIVEKSADGGYVKV